MTNREEWKVFDAAHNSNDLMTIAALVESIELLREDNERYRRSNALLRRINSDLRALKNIQVKNDDEFRSMCQGDFDCADVTDGEEGFSNLSASQI